METMRYKNKLQKMAAFLFGENGVASPLPVT